MSQQEQRMLTTEEACRRLGMSRATFYNRLKDRTDIKPINYNPNLRRQPDPKWRLEDVDQLGDPMHPEINGEPISSVA